MIDVVATLAQVVAVAAAAPLLVGLLRTLKARLTGRRGPVPWQPYADLRKLLGKEVVVSTNASWIFRATPFVLFATMVVSAAIVPVLLSRPALGFAGNIIVLMYLFLLGTFFLALAGLDTASAFGGMGASREVAVAALAEPTVILAVLALALRAGTIDLGLLAERFAAQPLLAANPGHVLAFVALFIVMIAETGRIPVDNPATHLELTMIHEAMVMVFAAGFQQGYVLVPLAGLTLLVVAFGGLLRALGAMLGGQPPATAPTAGAWWPALPIVLALAVLVASGVAWPPGLAAALDAAAAVVRR